MKQPRPWLVWLITVLMTTSLVGTAMAGKDSRGLAPIGLPIEEPGDMNGEPEPGPNPIRIELPYQCICMVLAGQAVPMLVLAVVPLVTKGDKTLWPLPTTAQGAHK